MHPEPERQIEKLLRACAGNRREQAGPPPDLHPATRRLLHDEVRRRFPQAAPGRATLLQMFGRFRLQLFEGLALIALLAVVASVLLPPLHKSRTKLLATNDKKSDPSAALPQTTPNLPVASAPSTGTPASAGSSPRTTPDLPPAPAPPTGTPASAGSSPRTTPALPSAAAPAIGTPASAGSSPRTAPNFPTDAVPAGAAPNSSPSPGQTVVAASPITETAAASSEFKAGAGASLRGALAPATALDSFDVALKKQEASTVAENPGSNGQVVRQASRKRLALDTISGQAAGLGGGTPPPPTIEPTTGAAAPNLPSASTAFFAGRSPAVLASFQLEQAGQQLRIIDSDGSVYTGSIRWAGAPQNRPSSSVARLFDAKATGAATRRAEAAPASDALETRLPHYSF